MQVRVLSVTIQSERIALFRRVAMLNVREGMPTQFPTLGAAVRTSLIAQHGSQVATQSLECARLLRPAAVKSMLGCHTLKRAESR